MDKLVKIRPIKKNTWGFQQTGTIRYKNTKDHVGSFYDKTGSIYTGLTPEDAERLGKALGKDLSRNSSFWHEFKVTMTDKDKILDLSNPEHELAYLFLLNHYRVAKSITEQSSNQDYVIVDENKEAEVINSKALIKRKANKLFDSLTTEQKKDILKLYPGYIKSDNVSAEIADARLYELLEGNPAKFVEYAEDKQRDSKVLIKDLVDVGILRKNRSAIYYGKDNIGHDEESAITFINDPQNQGLKVALLQELKNK